MEKTYQKGWIFTDEILSGHNIWEVILTNCTGRGIFETSNLDIIRSPLIKVFRAILAWVTLSKPGKLVMAKSIFMTLVIQLTF